jgi:hypothetical protein
MQAFVGNLTTCLKVQSHHVESVVKLVCDFSNQVPELLELLCSVVKVSGIDVPLRRNQSYVMKCVMRSFVHIADYFNQTREYRYFCTMFSQVLFLIDV